MAVYKNKAQKLPVFAVDSSGAPKTGDAANITAQLSKDGGACAALSDTNPTELDATNAPGIYLFDLTQAETNADLLVVCAKSTTSGVTLRPVIVFTEPEQRVAASVAGDVAGKILGGGAGTITGTGARVVDANGNAVAPAATALSNATWTDARAGKLDNVDVTVSSRLPTATYVAPDNTSLLAVKTTTDRLATTMEQDGAVHRFTANALEQAPAGGGGSGGLSTQQAAELHLCKAILANEAEQDVDTGVIRHKDDDGTTVLLTKTPSEAAGTITITPS